jgi:guanine nucleotide-binding protein G(i) subunit alpha
MEKYFPDYTGGPNPDKGTKYILSQFMEANRARLSVYTQYIPICVPWCQFTDGDHSITQATDTSNIRVVFSAVEDTVLRKLLEVTCL